MLSAPFPRFGATAAQPYDPGIPQFRRASDHDVHTATITERPKIVIGNLKVSTLLAERRTEKQPAPSAEQQETLCGLKGVMVFIEDIDADVEKRGLTKSFLQKEVESRLRHTDIPVLTQEEAYDTPGKPYLYLRLTTHNTGIDLYSYSVRLEFNQDVSLIRDPSVRTTATTWIANVVGIVGTRNLPAITEDVDNLADKFVKDYLAANRQ
jgi:hypothetical protein